MDLIEKAKHKGKQLSYSYNGNHYSSACKRLQQHSRKIQEYINSCREKLREIKEETGDSYGEVIANFHGGISTYKSKLNTAIEEAEEYKKRIDSAADKAYDIADNYYKLANEEEKKMKED